MIPKRIMDKVEFDFESGCWLWKGCLTRDSQPQGATRKGKAGSIRRYVYELDTKTVVPPGKLAICGCDEPTCINPQHTKIGDRSMVLKQAKKRGVEWITADVRAKIAARAQARSRLGWAKVREIRASDEPAHVMAARYGMGQSTIDRIRQHKTWVEPGLASIFAQIRK